MKIDNKISKFGLVLEELSIFANATEMEQYINDNPLLVPILRDDDLDEEFQKLEQEYAQYTAQDEEMEEDGEEEEEIITPEDEEQVIQDKK